MTKEVTLKVGMIFKTTSDPLVKKLLIGTGSYPDHIDAVTIRNFSPLNVDIFSSTEDVRKITHLSDQAFSVPQIRAAFEMNTSTFHPTFVDDYLLGVDSLLTTQPKRFTMNALQSDHD